MSRKKRRKRSAPKVGTLEASTPVVSSRWRFFVWMCSFFFLVSLLMRLDVMTAWPGSEGFALANAVGNDWGRYLPTALNHSMLPWGLAIDTETDAIWLFPRLFSAGCILLTAFFTSRWTARLFGREMSTLGLLCAAASLFLPFFGKVATADALALLGHAGMFWSVLLYTLAEDNKKLLPFGVFTLLAAIAAPVSTLLLSIMLVILVVFQRTDYAWLQPAIVSIGISCLVLLVQGEQEANTYWYYGQEDSRVLDLLYYGLLGMLPLAGWVIGGVRDLIFKSKQLEQFSLIIGMALVVTLLAQSLLFLLLVAIVAGKQMQLYFADRNYPWKDYVRAASVVHLVLAFIAAIVLLVGGPLALPGSGLRAVLGMAAAYWIFSLLATLGIFGDRRDFAIGGSILAGLLTTMFFWVQVYPYVEAERSWPQRLVGQGVEPTTLSLPDEADESELSSALPYLDRAGWELVEEGDYRLERLPVGDSTAQVQGRVIFAKGGFGLERE